MLRVYRGDDKMDEPITSLWMASALGALFGFGSLVHDPKAELSARVILGVLLYSAGNAFISGAAWHLYVDKNPLSVMMIAASSGLFGLPAKNILALIFKKSGIVSIRFNNSKKDAA